MIKDWMRWFGGLVGCNTRRALHRTILCLALAACGSAPRIPPVQQDGARFASQAAQAAQREDWLSAARLTRMALAHAAALDDGPRRFDLLLNLALIEQQQGALERAATALREAMPLAVSTAQQLRLRLREAGLALKRSDLPAAQTALTQAEALCGASCPERATVLNLRARHALTAGNATAAAALAAQAAGSASAGSAEAGNALRLQGQAALKLGQGGRAAPLFEVALGVDRQLGLAERIGEDLDGLAAALQATGRTAEAAAAAERAAAWRAGRKLMGRSL